VSAPSPFHPYENLSMFNIKKWSAILLLVIANAFLTGCNSDGLNEVTGTVTLDGKPLSGLEVRFEPIDPSIGTNAIGYTQADGTYMLHYPGDKTGAPAGEYMVLISGGENAEGGKPSRVPAKYTRATELKATVESGSNTIDFDLTSK
jgi:hypothetical protein